MKANPFFARSIGKGLVALAVAGAAVVFGLGSASAQCLEPPGDVNNDGVTNVLDLQCLIYVSLYETGAGGVTELPACLQAPPQAADINCDSNTDVSDVLNVVYYAVGLPLSSAVDGDGDQCPDACEVPAVYAPIPTIATGMSASPSWTLKATASGFQAKGTSSSTSFSLKPKAVTSQN